MKWIHEADVVRHERELKAATDPDQRAKIYRAINAAEAKLGINQTLIAKKQPLPLGW